MTANKVLSVLTLFSMERRTMKVEEISTELGIPVSSVYRHVRVLKQNGYLNEDHFGNYKLGYKFLELANIVRADIDITSISKPFMDELTTEFRETTILNVISGLNAVCLTTSVIDDAAIKVSSAEGKILPLFGGASAKALLAYQDGKILDRIFDNDMVKKITRWTITDKEELIKDLHEVRKKGYSVSMGELDEGVKAYGFPIKNSSGEVIASLTIAGPEFRMKYRDEEEIVKAFKDAVIKIEAYL
ncbi:IclR family transcriptional regulator [Salinicoccus kekensis]|uniref:IclR family transcriptional regulator n=1 Tax=Salinicoccus kekensis TaxID=714307 RepID=A0A285UU47_9STAP|nr:IclR family transcriptional regulator [Salinicoccus kekensis]SOC43751.1 IclR family transcriptional regulator [Salinicoccus kekensis]